MRGTALGEFSAEMASSNLFLGVTPARGGSKGITRKNLRLVAGKPLLSWTIEAALASKSLDRYVVSSEDPEIRAFAESMGAETLARPKELAADDSDTIDVLRHVLTQAPAEVVVLLQATSPIRSPGLVDRCVGRFLDTDADSLATGFITKLYEYGTYQSRRQELPGWFHDDGNVYVFRADLIQRGDRYGARRETLETSREENLEIDDEFDLWLASEMILRGRLPGRSGTPLLIIGAGDHARVLRDAADRLGIRVVGFISAPGESLDAKALDGLSVVGDFESLRDAAEQNADAIVGIGDNDRRREKQEAAAAAGMRVVSLIHPAAEVSTRALVEEGAFIAAGSVVGPSSTIGKGVIINTGATVDHDCYVGDFAQIGPGAHLNGRVKVGEGTLLGVGAMVVQGAEIGARSIVGAGSVVTRDLPDGVIAWGVPARKQRRRE